jgi:arsenate reductase
MIGKKRVLILCTGNSARSQMAEGLLRHDAGDRFEVESAGTAPSAVRPEAIAVMRELDIDIAAHRSKHLDEFSRQRFDYVLTVCDRANETCPLYPGTTRRLHQDFADPAAVAGPEEERLARFRRVRDELRRYLKEILAQSEGWLIRVRHTRPRRTRRSLFEKISCPRPNRVLGVWNPWWVYEGVLRGGPPNVLCPRSLWSFADVELDAIALTKIVEPLAIYGTLVEEIVLPGIVLDEPEPLVDSQCSNRSRHRRLLSSDTLLAARFTGTHSPGRRLRGELE